MFIVAGQRGTGSSERGEGDTRPGDFPAGARRAGERGAAGRAARTRRKIVVLWGWLTQTGYRPELHYMRGGRSPPSRT